MPWDRLGDTPLTDVAWGFAIAHASIATFDIVLPSIGFAVGSRRPEAGATPGPRLAPVVVGGVDAGGRRWSGFGLKLSSS